MYVCVCRGIGWWCSDVVKTLHPVLVSSSPTKHIFYFRIMHVTPTPYPAANEDPHGPSWGLTEDGHIRAANGDLHDPGWGWTGDRQDLDHWLCLNHLRSRLDLGYLCQIGNAGSTPASPCPVPGA